MGTASSVNIGAEEEPLTFGEALKRTNLHRHEKAIANILGFVDKGVLEDFKKRLHAVITETCTDGGASTAQLQEFLESDATLKESLEKADQDFKNLLGTLLNNPGEKANIVTAAEVNGILSAPPLTERRQSKHLRSMPPCNIKVTVMEDTDPGNQDLQGGSLRAAATHYNQSTRLINSVMDAENNGAPSPHNHKRNRKASLSIGIDLSPITHSYSPLSENEAAIIIQKTYRGFLSRKPTPRPRSAQ